MHIDINDMYLTHEVGEVIINNTANYIEIISITIAEVIRAI